MTINNNSLEPASKLDLLAKRLTRKLPTELHPEIQAMFHELETYKIELDMQNETLRKTHIALQESRDCYMNLYEFCPEGYLTLTSEGKIKEINLTAATLFGIERNQLLNCNFTMLVAPHDRDRWHRLLINMYQYETLESIELQLQLQRHKKNVFDAHLKVLGLYTNDNVWMIRINFSDITKLKELALHQQQEALNKAGALQNAIFNSANFSSIATDAKGVIQIFNVGAQNMLGYSADEVTNKITPADISDPQEIIARAVALSLELGTPIKPGFDALVFKAARGIEDIYELTYIRKDGSQFPAVVSVTALRDAENSIIGYLLIGTNNTERKQLQATILLNKENEAKLLLDKEKAEYLLKIKSQFIATMSHEIRTPMSAIMGLSQLALNQALPLETQNYLKNINAASKSLMSILNDILDFSKLDAGRLAVESEPFHLNDLLDMLYSLFIDATKEKGLTFNIEVAANIPSTLIGDRLRLQQILSNLLGNAIKFTAHGAVTLKITLLQIDLSQVRLLFCVSDTGIGISAEDHHKLFQPFTQVDGSITRRFGGTGLGLAISHNLLQLMDSEFSLTSTPELGSTFSFELALDISTTPIQYQVAELSTTLSPTLNYHQKLVGARILVTEDNLLIQQVIRETLTLSGIIITIANNGQEALTLVTQNEFDGILMDIHMPIMNGFEATQRLRSLPGFATLPVIALTASISVDKQAQCLAVGMNDFISKPIDSNQILLTLAQWLEPKPDRNRLIQSAIELDGLIQEQDFIPEALLSNLKTQLAPEQFSLFNRLHQLIQELRYKEARTLLYQLITSPNTQETL
jgi:PAS domain S-box-containing protein